MTASAFVGGPLESVDPRSEELLLEVVHVSTLLLTLIHERCACEWCAAVDGDRVTHLYEREAVEEPFGYVLSRPAAAEDYS
jgi:hypothetical protein